VVTYKQYNVHHWTHSMWMLLLTGKLAVPKLMPMLRCSHRRRCS